VKLLQYTGRYFLGFSFLTFLVGGFLSFWVLSYLLDHEMDENLLHTRSTLLKELNKLDSLPAILEIMDEVIDLREVPKLSKQEIFKDTLRLVDEEGEKELESYRQYIYTDQI